MQNRVLALLKCIYSRVLAPPRSALGRFLAYELEKKYQDHSFLAFLRSLGNSFLVYFPLFYLLRFLQRLFSEEPWYPIEDEIVLTTTRVIFTSSTRTVQHICLKICQ